MDIVIKNNNTSIKIFQYILSHFNDTDVLAILQNFRVLDKYAQNIVSFCIMPLPKNIER